MAAARQSSQGPSLAKLRKGEPLAFSVPAQGTQETPDAREARTVPAQWLAELVQGHQRIVSVPLAITGAIITGNLSLNFTTFESAITFSNCEFSGSISFVFATFKR